MTKVTNITAQKVLKLFLYNITIQNETDRTMEYRAFLYDSRGELRDKEPDLSYLNIGSKQAKTLHVSASEDLVGNTPQITVLSQDGAYDERFLYDNRTGVWRSISFQEGQELNKITAREQPVQQVKSPIPTARELISPVINPDDPLGLKTEFTIFIILVFIVAIVALFWTGKPYITTASRLLKT